jgi:hypothetical protein
MSTAVKTTEQCSEAKPATPAMASAPVGSASTSSRARARLSCSSETPGLGQHRVALGCTNTGPSDGTR